MCSHSVSLCWRCDSLPPALRAQRTNFDGKKLFCGLGKSDEKVFRDWMDM